MSKILSALLVTLAAALALSGCAAPDGSRPRLSPAASGSSGTAGFNGGYAGSNGGFGNLSGRSAPF